MNAPDYPGAKWIPASATNYRRGALDRDVLKLVLHVTDGHEKAEDTAAMFARPHHGASAHFVIGQDGTVVQCVALDDIAWHAHRANRYSIGIEHCARCPGELSKDDPGLPLSEVQIEASVALVMWLCDRYKLPRDNAHVQGHAEADTETSHTKCPNGVAGGFPWARWFHAAPSCAPAPAPAVA